VVSRVVQFDSVRFNSIHYSSMPFLSGDTLFAQKDYSLFSVSPDRNSIVQMKRNHFDLFWIRLRYDVRRVSGRLPCGEWPFPLEQAG
jgi:hypothetical protein